MRWLPAFNFLDREVRLPLCAGTASVLLRAVHAASAEEFSDILASSLLVDPLSCLWFASLTPAAVDAMTVHQLAGTATPAALRSVLSSSAAAPADRPTPREMRRARRCAIATSIRIAQCESSWLQAMTSSRTLGCLLDVARQYLQADRITHATSVVKFASTGISESAGDAEALAWLDEFSPLGRKLGRRVVRAWKECVTDPQQSLQSSLQVLQRLDILETQFQDAVQDAKLAALKELAYGASHEINNPLTNIAARAQLLLKKETTPDRRRALSTIHQQAIRAYEMIADLMLFAKPPVLQTERMRVAEFVSDVVDRASRDAAGRSERLQVVARLAPTLGWIDADRIQLSVAMDAICRNALEAMGEQGVLAVLAAPGQSRGGTPELRLRVRDSGPGIPPHVMPHLFDPFFSGRDAGRGLGFGLSKAWRIVNDHGGKLFADSKSAKGASFTLHLPGHVPRRTHNLYLRSVG